MKAVKSVDGARTISDASNIEKTLAETNSPTTGEEHVHVCRGTHNAGSEDYEGSADKHTPSTSEVIVERTGEWQRCNATNVVHGKDETSSRGRCFPVSTRFPSVKVHDAGVRSAE